jgi:putative copper export protein/methionine-rich copper-binding protein CopC
VIERTRVPSPPRPASSRRDVLQRVGLAVAAAVLAMLSLFALTPSVARADNSVVSSEPADGASVAASPEAIVITFAEELGEANTIALDCNTDLYTLGRPAVGDDGRTLSATVADVLPRGTCVARWRVSNADGEPNGAGNITFNVESDAAGVTTTDGEGTDTSGTGTGGTGTDGTETSTTVAADGTGAADGTDTESADEVIPLEQVETIEGPLWLGRLLSVLGIATMFGALVLIAAAWPEGVEYLIAVRFIRSSWIVALIGTVLYVAAATAAVSGESLGAGFNPTNWPDLLDAGWPARAALARLVLVVIAAWVAFRPDRVIIPATQMAALGIPALAVITIGFSRTDGPAPVIGVVMGVIHALAMAIWVGGAILLARVVLVGPGEEDLVHAVRGFGRISVLAIIATVVSGIVQMIRLDGGSLFGSSHGQVVVLKAVLVAVMLFIALSARQFVNHRLARANEMTVAMSDRLRRAFGVEAAIGVVVLAMSSWLLVLDPPNVDTTPSIDYAITRTIEVPDREFEVTVKLTSSRASVEGLEVEVLAPPNGLSNLEIVFTAPPNDSNVGTVVQPIPLTEPGVAVRPQSDGLPLTIPGDWTLHATAITPLGTVDSEPQVFTLLNEDGSAPTTQITVPPSVTVTIAPTTTPATTAAPTTATPTTAAP